MMYTKEEDMKDDVEAANDASSQNGDVRCEGEDCGCVSGDASVSALKAENDELKNQCRYFAAEIENVRKRLQRERDEGVRYAVVGFARDLLSVCDNLQRVRESISSDCKDGEFSAEHSAMAEGVMLVEKELFSVLEKYGISKIPTSAGDDPSPDVHEVLSETASEDVENGKICFVVMEGYMMKERLLRPARVIVCRK